MKNQLKKWLKIGILGGMGPIATMELYKRIIHLCQTKYGCVQDYEFPQIIINSVPLEGFTEKGVDDMEQVKTTFLQEMKTVKDLADFFVVPCNTLHCFYEDVADYLGTFWLSLPKMVLEEINSPENFPIGILSSEHTKKTALYKSIFQKVDIPVIETTETEQIMLNDLIEKVMSSKNTIHDNYALYKIISSMLKKGAKSILLGCTELPLVNEKHFLNTKIYDSLDILAKRTLEYASKS